MSGHSHAKTIRHQKNITDQKRGQMFSKLAREIEIAAKEGGGDPEFNPKLRLAIEKAKGLKMPTENIERAIKRGTGELVGEKLEEVLFEAYGPGGIAIIIEGITNNRNRTSGEIKQILNQNNGKLASEGSVKWMFTRSGCLIIDIKNQKIKIKNDELEILAIEAGAEDTYWHNNFLDVYTRPEESEKIKKNLEVKGIIIENTSLDWVAKEMVKLNDKEKEACQKLFEALDENDSVQEIYSNIKLP